MRELITLFEVNPALDHADLSRRFAAEQRLQVRDVLTPRAAEAIHDILENQTRWGVAWQAGREGPAGIRAEEIACMSVADQQAIGRKVHDTMRGEGYAFIYSQYRVLDAYLQQWDSGSPYDLLLEHINAPEFLDFVRTISGMDNLIKADAQATLYRPGQFLALHDDLGTKDENRKLAYVLNMTREPWRPDWGGYLLFYDAAGDVVTGFRPRFNALNIFMVPQRHNVTYVPPFAPVGRYTITGWFRDA